MHKLGFTSLFVAVKVAEVESNGKTVSRFNVRRVLACDWFTCGITAIGRNDCLLWDDSWGYMAYKAQEMNHWYARHEEEFGLYDDVPYEDMVERERYKLVEMGVSVPRVATYPVEFNGEIVNVTIPQ